MESLKIAKVHFPEPGRSPLPDLEDTWEFDQRNRRTVLETGKDIYEWEAELLGKNVLDQPDGPAGWTAWSVILANGEVVVVMFRTIGLLQRRLWSIVADLNHFFADKIPFTVELVYNQMQRIVSARMREMCGTANH